MERTEFNAWMGDFGRRYPAVAEYVKRRELPDQRLLLDTWHQTLSAFDRETLDAVTAGIISGDLDPVPNVALGTFAEEIRQRCRRVLDKQRRETRPEPQQREPILDGNMVMAIACGQAALELLDEMGTPCVIDADYFRLAESVQPKIPFCAAIILADDHTEEEARIARQTLDEHGIPWEHVLQRVSAATKPVVQEVE